MIDKIFRYFGYRKVKGVRRGYSAGLVNRLTADWIKSPLSADADIRYTLKTMRARSRELAINNDYARKFIKMCLINVIGPKGITLQVKAKDLNGKLDRRANQLIEDAFRKWSYKDYASVDGSLCWCDIKRLVLETVVRDGEVLIRKVKGFDNDFGFALQLLEPDHLDEELNKTLGNGNKIRMGIEFNKWNRPVAYYILANHPGDYIYGNTIQRQYERIPANEIIHLFVRERISQSRGVPWMHSAMTRLNMLGAYEEAALVAARAGACKMGFLKTPTGEEYIGDDKDDSGNVISETEPGLIEQLPAGWEFSAFDPKYPDANYMPFMKIMLRGIASGLLVAYNSLASDLEGVNYSSIRAGVIEERDSWRIIQRWFIEHFCDDIFSEWLDMALLTQAIPLPVEKYEKFDAAKWHARGWAWVDPLKDEEANRLAVNNGFNTRSAILAEQGLDLEEVFEQLAEEKELQDKLGLVFDGEADQKIIDKVNEEEKPFSKGRKVIYA